MISVAAAGLDDEWRAVRRHAALAHPPSTAPRRSARRAPAGTIRVRDSRGESSRFLWTTGELPWPQLISNGPYSAPRCFFHTSLPDDIDRGDLPGAEPRVDALAVGDRARRREVVLLVDRRQRSLRPAARTPRRCARSRDRTR